MSNTTNSFISNATYAGARFDDMLCTNNWWWAYRVVIPVFFFMLICYLVYMCVRSEDKNPLYKGIPRIIYVLAILLAAVALLASTVDPLGVNRLLPVVVTNILDGLLLTINSAILNYQLCFIVVYVRRLREKQNAAIQMAKLNRGRNTEHYIDATTEPNKRYIIIATVFTVLELLGQVTNSFTAVYYDRSDVDIWLLILFVWFAFRGVYHIVNLCRMGNYVDLVDVDVKRGQRYLKISSIWCAFNVAFWVMVVYVYQTQNVAATIFVVIMYSLSIMVTCYVVTLQYSYRVDGLVTEVTSAIRRSSSRGSSDLPKPDVQAPPTSPNQPFTEDTQ